jgi:hypothetical protein
MPGTMHSTGQTSTQALSRMHSSKITWVILKSLLDILKLNFGQYYLTATKMKLSICDTIQQFPTELQIQRAVTTQPGCGVPNSNFQPVKLSQHNPVNIFTF